MRRMVYVMGWVGFWLASASLAFACRYSVRDTGFVDLGQPAVELQLREGAAFSSESRLLLQEAASALHDGNLAFSTNLFLSRSPAVLLRLVDSQGRVLELPSSGVPPRTRQEASEWMERVAFSPMRERVQREALRSYAVVLLIEGTDERANERTRAVVRQSIESVSRLIPGMAKPVETPPQLLVLPLAAQAEESVLIWSLGLAPAPSTDPRLAILYGRGRRLGDPLEGPMITQTVLRERLVLLGQDCECDLDRAWLRGPLIVARWGREMQELTAKALGFDPENPVVRAEVSRIVERGPQPGQRRKTAVSSQLLGYSEAAVDSLPEATDVVETAETRDTGKPAAAASLNASASNPMEIGTSSPKVVWWVLGGGVSIAMIFGAWLVVRSSSR